MLGLIILCLVAAVSAAPQYSYDQGATGLGGGGGGGSGGGGGGGGGVGIGIGSIGSLGSSSGGGGLQSIQPAIYNKQFYIHSAPDDELDNEAANQLNQLTRRNLRVVFIKSPENKGLENAALQLAKAAGEDRTAIYVLNKQTDLGELQNKLSQIQDLNVGKPEVHFVKYKTPQEAEHAQHSIQAQYDQLGGPSQVSNEGIAPVRSFVGALGSPSGIGGGGGGSRGGPAAYLPPQFRH